MPTTEEIIRIIRPVKVRNLPGFLKACEPMASSLMAGDVSGAMVNNIDGMIEAVALGADVDRDWLDEQTSEELLDLGLKVFEVNIDFFVQRLLPRITEAAKTIGDAMPSGGMNGSAGSSEQGSATNP